MQRNAESLATPAAMDRTTNSFTVASRDVLTDVLRDGAQQLLARAIEVEVAFVDQGYTGDEPESDAADEGIELTVVKLDQAKRRFVLLPRRWVVERSFAWVTRFRRFAKDYERLPTTVEGLHYVAFVCLMLKNLMQVIHQSA